MPADVQEIVFAVRTSVRRHYYENYGFAPFPRSEYPYPTPGELGPEEPLFFVALDENDMSVMRMQSFLTVQPGEKLSCVGCHEN